MGKNEPSNQVFIKINIFVSFTIFRFIENRRRAIYGEASCRGSCFPRVVDALTRPLHCFRSCLMFHIVCRYCCSIAFESPTLQLMVWRSQNLQACVGSCSRIFWLLKFNRRVGVRLAPDDVHGHLYAWR